MSNIAWSDLQNHRDLHGRRVVPMSVAYLEVGDQISDDWRDFGEDYGQSVTIEAVQHSLEHRMIRIVANGRDKIVNSGAVFSLIIGKDDVNG